MIVTPIQYLHELSKPIITNIKDSIVPIYSYCSNNIPYLKGSGVLISLGTRKFLITAAHLLNDAKFCPLFYFSRNNFNPFNGKFWRTPKATSFSQDFLDVAVLELTNKQANELADNQKFYETTFDTISFGTEHKLFFLLGFPFRRNKVNMVKFKLKNRIFPYLGSKIEDKNILKGINRSAPQNLVLDYQRKRIRTGNNDTTQGPKVVSCSGGGIFEVDTSEMFKSKRVKIRLSAIFIEYSDKARGLVGTNICFPLEIIRYNAPELSDLIPKFAKFNFKMNG